MGARLKSVVEIGAISKAGCHLREDNERSKKSEICVE